MLITSLWCAHRGRDNAVWHGQKLMCSFCQKQVTWDSHYSSGSLNIKAACPASENEMPRVAGSCDLKSAADFVCKNKAALWKWQILSIRSTYLEEEKNIQKGNSNLWHRGGGVWLLLSVMLFQQGRGGGERGSKLWTPVSPKLFSHSLSNFML